MNNICGSTTITLTGDQTGLSPRGAEVLRCNNSSLLSIHGIAAGCSGQRITVISVGSGQVDVVNQSNSENIPANRIINNVTGKISLAAGVGRMILVYDEVSELWRVVEHAQGSYLTPEFSSSNFTGYGTMIWSVDTVDVITYTYYLVGRMLTLQFEIDNSSVSGTPTYALQLKIPGGLISAKNGSNPIWLNDTTFQLGIARVGTGSDQVRMILTNGGNWSASTNTTRVHGQITFEVQ